MADPAAQNLASGRFGVRELIKEAQYDNVEDDGFITVVGLRRKPDVPVEQRCADCPRLLTRTRHPATNIGE